MLKRIISDMVRSSAYAQPPSGGCVLKPDAVRGYDLPYLPAAFRRLCVETAHFLPQTESAFPAAFRRLCVETSKLAML